MFSAVERASAVSLALAGSLPRGEASKSSRTFTKTWACCTATSFFPIRPAMVTMRDWSMGASGATGSCLMSRW